MIPDVLQFPKYVGGWQGEKGAERNYHGEYKGLAIGCSLWTRKNKSGWGKGKIECYYVVGEKTTYKTMEEFWKVVEARTSMKIV